MSPSLHGFTLPIAVSFGMSETRSKTCGTLAYALAKIFQKAVKNYAGYLGAYDAAYEL